MTKYKHIFFDLDRTIWNFDKNSIEVLKDIFSKYDLEKKGIPSFDKFYEVYYEINHELWAKYRIGAIKKDFLSLERFWATLRHFSIDEKDTAYNMSQDYVKLSPFKTHLFPNSHEILNYLKEKYTLHLITNGFAEVQTLKIKNSNLEQYFDEVIISEQTPWKKPNPAIFKYAINQVDAKPEDCIMIGDDIKADIQGAASVGMDNIWTNLINGTSDYKPMYEVNDLIEIKDIL
ncbi:MAG: noncanonical pyrimidine nucleotidase, YjjG family [Bacteroidetes bacterium]|nr:MAG: noncanonical pyrimidine nucleotidase, YjjG family [Bacteroidota bacterium]